MGNRRPIAQEELEKIHSMMDRGLTNRQIHWFTGRAISTIQKIRSKKEEDLEKKKSGDTERILKERMWMWVFLHKNWNWVIPMKQEKESKYRKVHPGDKGIRTPYRPDGIFH